MATVTISNGIFTVPRKDFYAFKRTPEIMAWFTSLGYGFHGRTDADEEYAAIAYDREHRNDLGFSNCSKSIRHLERGIHETDNCLNITGLIEAHLASLHSEYEYW